MRAAEKVVLSIFLQWDKEPSDVGQDRIDAWYVVCAIIWHTIVVCATMYILFIGIAPSCVCATMRSHVCATMRSHVCATMRSHVCATMRSHVCATMRSHVCATMRSHVCATMRSHVCATMRSHVCATMRSHVCAIIVAARSLPVGAECACRRNAMKDKYGETVAF